MRFEEFDPQMEDFRRENLEILRRREVEAAERRQAEEAAGNA